MKQCSFAEAEYTAKKKITRRDKFLAEMEQVVPWAALLEVLERFYYPQRKGPGRRPVGLERMLRLYFVQQWYGLADEALEDAVYDSQALRSFIGIDLSRERVPDATTVLKFRRRLEENDLAAKILETINEMLRDQGLLLHRGTVVDATLLAAPSSTKNRSKARDPQMHQTKKGNQWYFGMKGHIGVDMASGLVHSVEGTAANVSDVSQTQALLHGQEEMVFADAGYTGVQKRPEFADTQVTWHIAAKRGTIKKMAEGPVKELTVAVERTKAQIRAIVEHPFHIIKDLFHHRKVRYRGLAKNTHQLHTLFALANLVIAKRTLLA